MGKRKTHPDIAVFSLDFKGVTKRKFTTFEFLSKAIVNFCISIVFMQSISIVI
jgi:hypothetical protein